MTRSPARTLLAAFWSVRHGLADEPAAASFPVGATKSVRKGVAGADAGAASRRLNPDTMDASTRRPAARAVEECM
jgi:hypothetical protein